MCKQLSHSIISQYTSQSNIDNIWSFFKEGCQKILEDNVPSWTTSQRFSQPWINRDIRNITCLKRRWFGGARKTRHPKDWTRYKVIKKKAQKSCRKQHDQHVNDMLMNDNQNPKGFWNFIKSRKKDHTGVAPLKKDGHLF